MIFRVALREPVADGINATVITVLAPGATVIGRGDVRNPKSAALAPETAKFVMVRSAVPLLVTVTVFCAPVLMSWFPNESELLSRLTAGAIPVPEIFTVEGLPAALCATVSVAGRLPVVDGVKVRETVADPPATIVNGVAGELIE